jgi:hypothetical protein
VRKISLTPLQNKIMWLLEEAHEAELETIRVTTREDDAASEQDLGTALAGLERLGFIYHSDSRAVLTETGYAALTK